jgi:hypothetical protein
MEMKTSKHSGATLFGIYWTLFFSFLEFLLGLYLIIHVSFIYYLPEGLALGIPLVLFSFLALFFGLNFNRGRIKDYVLVGLISLLPSLFIGGLFILFDGNRSIKLFYAYSDKIQPPDSLEYKLKEIGSLLERGVISKEEYDLKRSQIISKF